MDRYLVDTSVWIEFFRKKQPWYSRVAGWIDEDSICCNGLIYAELLQGAKTEKEIKTLKEFLHVFEFLKDSPELWEEAGILSYRLKRKGKTVGLADCYIAMLAHKYRVTLVTTDKHFKTLVAEISFNLSMK